MHTAKVLASTSFNLIPFTATTAQYTSNYYFGVGYSTLVLAGVQSER